MAYYRRNYGRRYYGRRRTYRKSYRRPYYKKSYKSYKPKYKFKSRSYKKNKVCYIRNPHMVDDNGKEYKIITSRRKLKWYKKLVRLELHDKHPATVRDKNKDKEHKEKYSIKFKQLLWNYFRHDAYGKFILMKNHEYIKAGDESYSTKDNNTHKRTLLGDAEHDTEKLLQGKKIKVGDNMESIIRDTENFGVDTMETGMETEL